MIYDKKALSFDSQMNKKVRSKDEKKRTQYVAKLTTCPNPYTKLEHKNHNALLLYI